MKQNTKNKLILSVLSAVLLSMGFLFPHCGGFALFALVPLLWMDKMASENGEKHFFLWYYLTFLLWNLITTFWVCNATVAGGIAASVCNALFVSLVWLLFRGFKRFFSGVLPYIFLAATWIAWERFYFDAEVSWPWLTLGNAFARSTSCIQWYEITGTLGGSVWIWACNLAVFGLLNALQSGNWRKFNRKARGIFIAGTVILFVAPLAASWVRYATIRPQSEETVAVGLLQPDFDPYEKFESMTQDQQNQVLLSQISEVESRYDTAAPLLLLAPETFTGDVILNEINHCRTILQLRQALTERENTNLIFGASAYQFFYQDQAPSYTARPYGPGMWYENYNSALVIDRTPRTGLYHKSRLVIGTEKMPWPRVFSKIEKLLGGNVMGHCIGQDNVGLLDFVQWKDGMPQSTPLGCAICYESVYPEYFASYVKEGAKAMTVITNDAWWGDTPGYKQHLSYSCLRAIETRRDIARCANTGISAFINQRGDIVSSSSWWERQTLCGEIHFSSHITPFVKYGDICGRVCTLAFILLLFAWCIKLVTESKPKKLI